LKPPLKTMNSIAQAETLVLSQPAADLSPLQAVIFDWAGTLVDFGSLAPTQIFVEAFASFGITITLAQARAHGPVRGTISTSCCRMSIAAQWQTAFGRTPTDEDVDAIYARFMPLQIAKVGEFSAPIAGAVQTLQWLRAQGLKVGSCSGYPREVLEPAAAGRGRRPQARLCGGGRRAGSRWPPRPLHGTG
jgi:phosphonoacetaldehyde hydrolase